MLELVINSKQVAEYWVSGVCGLGLGGRGSGLSKALPVFLAFHVPMRALFRQENPQALSEAIARQCCWVLCRYNFRLQ